MRQAKGEGDRDVEGDRDKEGERWEGWGGGEKEGERKQRDGG